MQENSNEILTAAILFSIFTLMLVIVFFIVFKRYLKSKINLITENEHIRARFSAEILQARLEIQEQTFTDISQEIHDNVGQVLSLAKVQINIMKESESISRDMLDRVKDNISNAINDLRDISKSLNGNHLQLLGIHDILELEIDRLNKSGCIMAKLETSGVHREITAQRRLILFRIIQETVQNTLKHSNATKVFIEINYLENNLEIIVNDNGSGFDNSQNNLKKNGLGLQNIKSRTFLLGGECWISSELGAGASIKIKIPYE